MVLGLTMAQCNKKLRFGYDSKATMDLPAPPEASHFPEICAGYFGGSVSSMGTVPPSLTCTVLFTCWYPFRRRTIVRSPEEIWMRAGVNCPVDTPSTIISAPFGMLVT